MLGYELEDLQQMSKAIDYAIDYVPLGQDILIEDLRKTWDFLQGLWAEGYFD